MLYIHPDECVDCGACEPVCPVEAIFYEDDVPAQWSDYTKANVDFFDELGSPGGASKVGKTDHDPECDQGRCRRRARPSRHPAQPQGRRQRSRQPGAASPMTATTALRRAPALRCHAAVARVQTCPA